MQELDKILEEIEDTTRQEDSPIYYGDVEVDGYIRMSAVEDIIRKHMNDGWIPVDKELPKEGQEVWVSAKTECVKRGTYTKIFGDRRLEGFICSDGFMWMNTANAWRPYVTPDPYRPERSDGE